MGVQSHNSGNIGITGIVQANDPGLLPQQIWLGNTHFFKYFMNLADSKSK